MPNEVRVTGLKELRKALRDLQPGDSLKELQLGLKAAADIAAREAKLRANVFSFRASDTIRALSGGNRAYIAGGGTRLSWYGWADFGSRTPRHGQRRSVGPWTHSGKGPKGGRFIYPALADTKAPVSEAVANSLDLAFHRLGFA